MQDTASTRHSQGIPLRFALTVPFLLQIFVAVSVVGWLSWRNGQQAVVDLTQQLHRELAARTEQYLCAYLAAPHQVNRINGRAVASGDWDLGDAAAREQQFWRQLQDFTVDNVAFGSASGDFTAVQYSSDRREIVLQTASAATGGQMVTFSLTETGERGEQLQVRGAFDPRQRSWYRETVQAGRPIWNSVFAFFSDAQLLVLPASRPLYGDDGQLLGVVTARLYLAAVNGFLASLDAGPRGEIFILERDGQLVAT